MSDSSPFFLHQCDVLILLIKSRNTPSQCQYHPRFHSEDSIGQLAANLHLQSASIHQCYNPLQKVHVFACHIIPLCLSNRSIRIHPKHCCPLTMATSLCAGLQSTSTEYRAKGINNNNRRRGSNTHTGPKVPVLAKSRVSVVIQSPGYQG